MIHKSTSPFPQHIHVTFELPASVWADKIFLAGDFNDWRADELPFRQENDGAWRIALDLRANRRYQFRYVVDGQWQSDWHADGFEENAHGSQNSIVDTAVDAADGTTRAATADMLSLEDIDAPDMLAASQARATISAAMPYLKALHYGYFLDRRAAAARNAA
ncbi:MAG: isoamylase early set domain-containing protein [Caldilineaceae bacterium]|nr:isoamylase early set domain-containing protein [Caldilineaceae bacterium]